MRKVRETKAKTAFVVASVCKWIDLVRQDIIIHRIILKHSHKYVKCRRVHEIHPHTVDWKYPADGLDPTAMSYMSSPEDFEPTAMSPVNLEPTPVSHVSLNWKLALRTHKGQWWKLGSLCQGLKELGKLAEGSALEAGNDIHDKDHCTPKKNHSHPQNLKNQTYLQQWEELSSF